MIERNVSEWTSWSPGCSPSAPVQQTRERYYLSCDQGIQCQLNCPNMTDTRISKHNEFLVTDIAKILHTSWFTIMTHKLTSYLAIQYAVDNKM